MVKLQRTPPGWGKDSLTSSLDEVRSNQFATYAKHHDKFLVLAQIDKCYDAILRDPVGRDDAVALILAQRAHSAFRAASSLALSGQAVEATVMQRSCLEFTLYGVCVALKPEICDIWLKRNDNEKAKKTQKEAFKISNLRPILEAADLSQGKIWHTFYERTIEFGAHPNPQGVLSSANWSDDRGAKTIQSAYLHGDNIMLWSGVRDTCHVGLCSLLIFNHAFPGTFLRSGVREKTLELRTKVGKLFRAEVANKTKAVAKLG